MSAVFEGDLGSRFLEMISNIIWQEEEGKITPAQEILIKLNEYFILEIEDFNAEIPENTSTPELEISMRLVGKAKSESV